MHGHIISCDGHKLHYIFGQAGSLASNTICIMMHGIFSDKREDGRFERFARTLNDSGLDTLCFDFRGHGESEFDSSQFSISGALNDLSSIIAAAAENNYENYLACKLCGVYRHSLSFPPGNITYC